jgi:DNA replication protein DnaC
MTIEETINKLFELNLKTMAEAVREQIQSSDYAALSFEDKLGLLVEREWLFRHNRLLANRLKQANLSVNACLEDVHCNAARGVEKSTIRAFATCGWVRSKQNIIAVGATGTGKSYIASALAHCACRAGFRALRVRVPRLLHELTVAHADGSYVQTLNRLAKIDVLVLDDFLIAPLKDSERRDLLEVLEDRYGRSSTVVTSQLLTKSWHEALEEPTVADAICDRLVHNAHVLMLKGPSKRKEKGLETSNPDMGD